MGGVFLACLFSDLFSRFEHSSERSACVKLVDQFDFDKLYGTTFDLYIECISVFSPAAWLTLTTDLSGAVTHVYR